MSNSKYWEDRIAKNVWKTYNSLEEKNRELLEFYTDASKAIKEELYILAEKLSKDGSLSRSDMYKNNHLKKLEKRYEEIIKELGEKVEEFASQNMQEGFEKVYSDVQISLAVPDFAPVDKKLMEKMLNEPWKGSNFSKRLWKNKKKLTVGLNGILTTGLQQGKTVTEMAVNLHNFMGMGFNDCHRLVRTETMHYLNESSKKGYKDAGVQKVQFCAAEDERTCEVCGAMHKKVYPIDEAPILPLHPNCRCTWLPVLEEKKNSVVKSSGRGIIKMNLQMFAYIPKEKLVDYALNPDHPIGKEKAKVFKKALGYTRENSEELQKKILELFREDEMILKQDDQYGKRYEQIMKITGPNGKTANVLTAWIKESESSEPRLTSLYVTEKEGK